MLSAARILKKVKQLRYKPIVQIKKSGGLVRLGSSYGGWIFEDLQDLRGSTIVSCGLGEDASFDVDFAARYGAKVIVVDPTPRAISHFNSIQKSIGRRRSIDYVAGGNQPISAYPLDQITTSSLTLEPSALWVEDGRLKFFAPPDPSSVSHSIINFQNGYAQNTSHIEVAAICPKTLMQKYGLSDVPLMKLDIEGAEIPVLSSLVEHAIFPRQLLIEFDEIAVPSPQSKKKIEDADRLLRQSGYICRSKRGSSNFLYVRS